MYDLLKHQELIEIAAGCYGFDGYGKGVEDKRKRDSKWAAVVIKSTSLSPRHGNPEGTFRYLGRDSYWNHVGLSNPGIYRVRLPDLPNLRLSLFASIDPSMLDLIGMANGFGVDSYELNLSCPNVEEPLILKHYQQYIDAADKPIYLKLTSDGSIPLDLEGVAGVVCGNTVPYMGGGLSGRAIKEHNLLLASHYAPYYNVIGCGGVRNMQDVYDYLAVGCKRVQIGSAFLRSIR